MPAFQAGDAGSIPATRTTHAPVAQWIEQETSKLLVVGSIPTRGTINFIPSHNLSGYFVFAYNCLMYNI